MKARFEFIKKASYFCVLILGLLSFLSCQKKQKPSFIILAVDRLSFNTFSCSDDRNSVASGLNTLCQESLRYANAYTTSTQSASAMASLLTGRYPFDHGIHKNQDRINPRWPMVQEKFKNLGYRTSFFSANPSIMRQTGLSRGFDQFEDSSFLNQNSYTTPLHEQIRQLRNWMDETKGPHFSIIYNSDLETLNDEDSNLSRFERFDEKLGLLIQTLKKENLWEANYIVVVGLQGRSDFGRISETPQSSLHSENMNIAFFIKPPRQKGDEGINQRIDHLSTIADFGWSLHKLIDPDAKTGPTDFFDIVDYSTHWNIAATEQNIQTPHTQRSILYEATNTWSSNLEVKLAVLTGHQLYLDMETPQVYNKLNDGLETIDISDSMTEFVQQNKLKLESLRQQMKASQWFTQQNEKQLLYEKHRQYWFQSNKRDLLFEAERKKLGQNQTPDPISTLLIYYLNTKKDKDAMYEEARRISYNLAFENIWGLWDEKKIWAYPDVKTENQ